MMHGTLMMKRMTVCLVLNSPHLHPSNHDPCLKHPASKSSKPQKTQSHCPTHWTRQEPISTNPDQDRLDIESGPANGRVVKSSSDAQLNVNAGMLVAVVLSL